MSNGQLMSLVAGGGRKSGIQREFVVLEGGETLRFSLIFAMALATVVVVVVTKWFGVI